MFDRQTRKTPDIDIAVGEFTPTALASPTSSSYEEIALEGARLIDRYFSGFAQNVLYWSPWNVLNDTALVYGELDDDERSERFKTLLRHYFRLAEIHELSYVEYSGGGGDPIWAMLVEIYSADLHIGVDLCHWGSFGWQLKGYFRLKRYSKRQLTPMLELLIPGYPNVDCTRPLNELVLGEQVSRPPAAIK